MMKNPACFSDVKGSPQRSNFKKVGLGVLDVADPELAGHPHGVAKTVETEIDRLHAGTSDQLRRLDCVAASAATSNQNIDTFCYWDWPKRRRGK